ncbi:26S proteasome non-ATPase regulatory subunit [Artemisia annua]|uniref:26S proteasome non-ATPase regulatory subunit n=1 Tax=Artemisia annua TaxID=35608 RepID=A0A2U1PSL3_ARTAN|nr:26S proteasome non-ATPase regulatory subunit [Artemisia annua]
MAEVAVICVDSCYWVSRANGGKGLIRAQAEAIKFYCKEKLKIHPLNTVCLAAMGESPCFSEPTRDLEEISSALKRLSYTGMMHIPIRRVMYYFNRSDLPKRRLVVFAGGLVLMGREFLGECATAFKESNVAVDVINFGLQGPRKKPYLQDYFLAAADNNGNCRYLYAPSGSRVSLSKQLESSPIMPRVGEDEDGIALAALACLSMQKKREPRTYRPIREDEDAEDVETLGMNKGK